MTLLLHQGLEAPVADQLPVVRLASIGCAELRWIAGSCFCCVHSITREAEPASLFRTAVLMNRKRL